MELPFDLYPVTKSKSFYSFSPQKDTQSRSLVFEVDGPLRAHCFMTWHTLIPMTPSPDVASICMGMHLSPAQQSESPGLPFGESSHSRPSARQQTREDFPFATLHDLVQQAS